MYIYRFSGHYIPNETIIYSILFYFLSNLDTGMNILDG